MYNFNYYREDNLLMVDVRGEVSVADMIGSIRKLGQYRNYTDKLNILQDSRDMIPQIDLFDIPVIADELEKILDKYQFIKHADIHHLPASTAYALLYQYKTISSNYRYEIFDRFQSAADWLVDDLRNQLLLQS